MIAKRLPVLVLSGLLVLSAASLGMAQEIPMPKRYHTLTITMGGGAGLVVAMLEQEVNGKIAFCGAVWPLDEKREVLARKSPLMRELKVEIGGQDVPARFSVFPTYNSAEEATTAKCAVSKKPWQGPYRGEDINLTLRNSTLRE